MNCHAVVPTDFHHDCPCFTCKTALRLTVSHSLAAQLPGLKAELEKIVTLQAELEAHQRAMQAVQTGYQYQASDPATDFKAAIKQHMDGDQQLQRYELASY
jgi:hypothetical protein